MADAHLVPPRQLTRFEGGPRGPLHSIGGSDTGNETVRRAVDIRSIPQEKGRTSFWTTQPRWRTIGEDQADRTGTERHPKRTNDRLLYFPLHSKRKGGALMGASSDAQQTSVVVVGAMNPLIHHPAWYYRQGMLSDAKYQEALTNPQTVCAQPVAQLQLSKMVITCQLERWEVMTSDPDLAQRTVSLASEVFRALDQTPVQAFGFNFIFERKTRARDVRGYLARILGSLPLGLGEGTAASFVWQRASEGRQVNITVTAAKRSPDSIVITSNFNHPTPALARFEAKATNLGDLLTASFEVDRAEALASTDRIVASIEDLGVEDGPQHS